eukprot:2718335-Pleurochrysis_carterae.AAC.1
MRCGVYTPSRRIIETFNNKAYRYLQACRARERALRDYASLLLPPLACPCDEFGGTGFASRYKYRADVAETAAFSDRRVRNADPYFIQPLATVGNIMR